MWNWLKRKLFGPKAEPYYGPPGPYNCPMPIPAPPPGWGYRGLYRQDGSPAPTPNPEPPKGGSSTAPPRGERNLCPVCCQPLPCMESYRTLSELCKQIKATCKPTD